MTSSPAILVFGALDFGTIALVKPSFAASFRRICPPCTGRTSPAKPTSPKTISLLSNGLFFKEETIDSNTAKSTAGSAIFTPPTALINTS